MKYNYSFFQCFTSTRIKAFLIFFLILIANPIKATHMAGADIRFRCIGGNQYEVIVSFYRDCAGITPPSSISININSVSCAQNFTATANQTSVVEASPLCPAQLPNSTCNGGTLPGIQLYTYSATITLPANCTDWIVSYRDGNRNSTVTNISSPDFAYMYIEGRINNLTVSCNNSPDFTNPPIPYICNGSPFQYNHGVVDAEGDSLAYTFITPLDNAGVPVTYNAGFSLANPLTTSGGFSFNTTTGQMNFTPNGNQVAALAVRVDEYRNGVLIGSVIRDMQIVVINCTNNTPSIGALSGLTGGALSGSTISTCPGNTINFSLTATDADAGNILTAIHNISTNLTGSTVSIVGTNPLTLSVSWAVPAIPLANYTFSFTARDNNCPIYAQQSVGYTISTGPSILITPSTTTVCPGQSVTLTASGASSYLWNTGATTPSITVNPLVNTTYTVTGSVLGCTANGAYTVTMAGPLPLAISPATSTICAGQSITLTADPATNYLWSTGATTQSITVTPSSTTTYSVTANIGTCSAAGSKQVIIGAVPATGVTICQGGSGSLTSSYSCPSTSSTSIAQSTVFNSGTLDTSDPTWTRPIGGVTCSVSGSLVYYEVFTFTVSTNGSYTFDGCFPTIDGYGHLYQNAFNPASACGVPANFVVGDDDSAPLCGADPRFTATLSTGITYYLISTTYSAGATDSYSWTFTGPAGATLNAGTPGTLQWYTAISGGTPIATGSTFNPVGVPGSGLTDTNTPGTTIYYAACDNDPTCRTAVNFTIGVVTATGANICQGASSVAMTSAYVCPPAGVTVAQSTVFNSGTLDTSDPTWTRAISGTSCSLSGTTSYYDVLAFTVSTAGSYTFDGCFPVIDAYGFIYQNAFNAASPCGVPANFVIGDDDSAPSCGADPRMTVTLNPGVTYYLISSSFGSLATDTYSWTYTGPVGATINTVTGPAGNIEWYTAASGGTALATGNSFNPVGFAGSGLANTNTPGTTTYYVACSTNPTCRSAVNYVINAAPANLVWTGSVDNNWLNGANWDLGCIPSCGSSVVIPNVSPAPFPVISSTGAACQNITINASASVTTAGTNRLDVCGNFINNGTFTANSGTLAFVGTTPQSFTNVGSALLRNVELNNANNLTLLSDMLLDNSGIFTFAAGRVITTGIFELNLANNAATAMTGYGSTMYVQGRLRRAVSGTQSYNFPVGLSGFGYQLANVNYTVAPSGYTSLMAYFIDYASTTVPSATFNECGTTFDCILGNHGKWIIDPNVVGTQTYTVTLYPTGGSAACTPNTWTVMKQPTGAAGLWALQGTACSNGANPMRAGLTSFSEFAPIATENPLPVENLTFEATLVNKNNAQLTWNAMNEVNNYGYYLQRSVSGNTFADIHFETGKNATLNNYSFVDENLNTGIYLYRLRQVDVNGSEHFSKTEQLVVTNQDFTVVAPYPNPTNANTTLEVNLTDTKNVQVVVVNSIGQTLFQVLNKDLEAGNHKIEIQSNKLAVGLYTVNLQVGSEQLSYKLQVTK